MKYRVTLKNGDVHEFESPFTMEALRKGMNLPLTAIIEVINQPQETQNGTTGKGNAGSASERA